MMVFENFVCRAAEFAPVESASTAHAVKPRRTARATGGWKGLLRCVSATVILLLAGTLPTFAQAPKHPLDSLTAPEYWTSYEVLRNSSKVDAKTRYPLVQLNEPPKEEVLAWKPGQPMRRESKVVVKQGPQTFEANVDLVAKKLVSWEEVKGVQPNLTGDSLRQDPGSYKSRIERTSGEVVISVP